MQYPKLITALITPFKGGKLDLDGLEANIEFQIQSGVQGVLVLGTTGESPTLSLSERIAVIKKTVEVSSGRVFVMVGTGTNSTDSSIKFTCDAKELGADMALVVTPYYNRPTQEGIYQHFKEISEKSKFPICVYNIPKRAGQDIEVQTLKKMSKLPYIIGVKESSGDISKTIEVIKEIPEKFLVWSGDDALVIPTIALGGYGLISVTSNLIPEKIAQIVKMASDGEFEKSRALFYQYLPLINALFLETNPIPLKAAMNFCGMPAGDLRLPLLPMQEENKKILQNLLGYYQIQKFEEVY